LTDREKMKRPLRGQPGERRKQGIDRLAVVLAIDAKGEEASLPRAPCNYSDAFRLIFCPVRFPAPGSLTDGNLRIVGSILSVFRGGRPFRRVRSLADGNLRIVASIIPSRFVFATGNEHQHP
jgi:hypothetical protein